MWASKPVWLVLRRTILSTYVSSVHLPCSDICWEEQEALIVVATVWNEERLIPRLKSAAAANIEVIEYFSTIF